MSIIAGFKQQEEQSDDHYKNKDISNLSVFLQQIEAEIYIDNILLPMREAGLPCFTRHDSLIVQNGNEVEAELYTKAIFGKFGFRYNHVVEEKFWDVFDDVELEEGDFMQWVIDENELEQDFHGEIQE